MMLRTVGIRRFGILSAPFRGHIFGLKSQVTFQSQRFNSSSAAAAAAVPAQQQSEIISQLPSFSDAAAETASKLTSDTIGYLESVGLPGNWFMGIFEHTMEYIHVYTGLPWWATIVLTTIALRASLFPLSIKVSENMARSQRAKPELDAVKAKISDRSLSMRDKQLAQQELFQVMRKHGVKNRYALAPVAQMATSIGLFVSIREMCLLPVQGFQEQGAYWFQDLCASDPYAALPIISAVIYAGSISRGGEAGEMSMPSGFKKIMMFMPIASIPFTMQLSAGVSLYLTTSAFFSALQMFLFTNKTTRNALGLSPFVKKVPQIDPATGEKKKESVRDSVSTWVEKMRTDSAAKAEQYAQVEKANKIAKATRVDHSQVVIRQRRKKN